MKKRINFTAWGNKIDRLRLPAYAVKSENDLSEIDAVARSVASKNNLVVCAGPTDEGVNLQKGEPHERHFTFTIGRPERSGGYTPFAEVWVAIPVNGHRCGNEYYKDFEL